MEVEIISHTNKPLDTIYLACRQCYYDGSILDFDIESISDDKKERRIKEIIKSGHSSVLEHVNFTFGIKNISRACSHQLVRHRIASYSQQSQRYCEASKIDLEIPKSIQQRALKEFYAFEKNINDFYHFLIDERGIPKEDARSILPNAMPTNIVMTINCRSLLNFFAERTCSCAQEEIRTLAKKMLKLCKSELYIVFEDAGPKCLQLGYCNENEKRSCGLKPLK